MTTPSSAPNPSGTGILAGRTAVVTGASSGIGRATAQMLIEAGVRVALVGRSEQRLRDAANGWPADAWLPIECDVRDDDSVTAMAAQAEQEMGRVDILINSAGVFKVASLRDLDNETWRELWETNVNGTIFPTRALLPGMLERGLGYVVIVSSVAAHRGYAGMTGYGATKHAVTGFARPSPRRFDGRASASSTSTQAPWTPRYGTTSRRPCRVRRCSPRRTSQARSSTP